jgi:hypothetical protein
VIGRRQKSAIHRPLVANQELKNEVLLNQVSHKSFRNGGFWFILNTDELPVQHLLFPPRSSGGCLVGRICSSSIMISCYMKLCYKL